MNFSESTYEALAPFERYFKTACDADWCPNPGRAALDRMADALTEKDGRRTAVNHSCGSCILRAMDTALRWVTSKSGNSSAANLLAEYTEAPASLTMM